MNTQNNLLIFNFLNHNSTLKLENELQFHKSWDWLMPVIEKIENTNLSKYHYQWTDENNITNYNFQTIDVDISKNTCAIYIDLQLDPPRLIAGNYNTKYNTKLEACYNTIIEFINYYNKLTNNINE